MQNSNDKSENNLKDEPEELPSDLPKGKIIKSRNAWMKRAKEYAKTTRTMQEQIRNLTESREVWKTKVLQKKDDLGKQVEDLEKENKKLKSKLEEANSLIDGFKKKSK